METYYFSIMSTSYHRTNPKRLVTYSVNDANLRRLILWYKKHKNKLLFHLPKLYASISHLETIDVNVNKMRYSEKKELVSILEAAETTWKEYRQKKSKLKQQRITQFFTSLVK